MPLCTLHLLQLSPGTKPESFLGGLLTASPSSSTPSGTTTTGSRILLAARVRRPIIRATELDCVLLNSTRWDLMILLGPAAKPGAGSGSSAGEPNGETGWRWPSGKVIAEYVVTAGIPSRIFDSYSEKSRKLNSRPLEEVPLRSDLERPARTERGAGTGGSGRAGDGAGALAPDSQNLEVSDGLLEFARTLERGGEAGAGAAEGAAEAYKGPVSMLNLLHFHKGKEMKEMYYKYGQGFAKVAAVRGGDAKLVGSVVPPPTSSAGAGESDSRGAPTRAPETWWNEVSVVHYPSIWHFADMAADEEYQRINREYRIGALRDTALICTTEYDLAALRAKAAGAGRAAAKL